MACDMTMEIMGIKPEDLRQDLIDECCAVGAYMQEGQGIGGNSFYIEKTIQRS